MIPAAGRGVKSATGIVQMKTIKQVSYFAPISPGVSPEDSTPEALSIELAPPAGKSTTGNTEELRFTLP